MKSYTSARFRKALAKLPKRVQKEARKAYLLFKKDPYHPSLHFKRIHSSQPIYSVRITIEYRSLGVVNGNEIIWFWVGSHSDYDHLVSSL